MDDGYRGGSNESRDEHGRAGTSANEHKKEVRGEWQWGSNGNGGSVSISGYGSSTCSRAAGVGVLHSSLPSPVFLLFFFSNNIYM
jgi:hypothetical protein